MPVTYSVDVTRRLIRFTLSGTVTPDEMVAALDRAVNEAGAGRFLVLSDHRALTTPATTAQLQDLVGRLTRYREHVGGSRCAIVTAQPASFGMMRMFSVLAEAVPVEVDVFSDVADAERWLGLPQ
jgi:hypothetical protein